mmetsp:Transcript_45053/g.94470  ORF Transcript_45053/g.94470 Transcript_45053/m.94470 type:complete len:618 (-) Transcript_45053:227-2080(-)|eukprot:CAMPEP_0183710868 /NCGR_PEP_ID=MMETSP0737-20130205/6497_1 /TAXON_ID=385413 /ORGANISM="Thalassiosira miniscula, Strain CCMP1093" /LENGTH=617 /DNA_ID=CAMNT_0025939235 /DNA_START=84 /DNA_END=1937 /DNA_ORIENTATION=-
MNGSYTNGASGGGSIGPTIVKLPPLPESEPTSDGGINAPAAQSPSTHPPPSPSSVISARTAASATPGRAGLPLDPNASSPRLSSAWVADAQSDRCAACQSNFDHLFKRRHHCRLCGRLFCDDCSNTRSLIPPSALVLKEHGSGANAGGPSFSSRDDGDASVTYVSGGGSGSNGEDNDTLLYGRGLERRILLARHPQRTCHPCREQLAPLQEELCMRNSNAMRYNYIDEGDAMRRLCNSPLAFTLGHEVRKAAYALGNLLPGYKGRRGGGFVPASNSNNSLMYSYPPPEADPCFIPQGTSGCKTVDPTLRNLDGMHIPAKLLRRARGVAIVTSAKGGLGFAGFEIGTGLVVARRRRQPDNHSDGAEDVDIDDWSAPSAIGIAGFAWGALVGAQVSDHVFLLMTDDAVRLFSSERGKSIQLGADIGVAVGPLGRSAEADIGATSGFSRSLNDGDDYGGRSSSGGIAMAPIYTYSLSKGLYAGVSLDGRVLLTRDRVNEKFYGRSVSAYELLSGKVPTPPAAQPLYDALKRCRIYGGDGGEQIVGSVERTSSALGGVNDGMMDGYDMDGANGQGGGGGSGLMERFSHTTGAGLPVSSTANSRYSSPNPYNLSGRDNYAGF